MRYRVDLSFHGAGFHGWQRQLHDRTVQGELESWLTRLLAATEQIAVTGAGRTDAGVHASAMVAHFDTELSFDPVHLTLRLQAAIPPDLVVHRVSPAPQGFHARYSAVARGYEYHITNRPSPFDRDRVWYVPGRLSMADLKAAATLVLGRHDFSGFCIAASRKEQNTCDLTHSSWECVGETIVYRARADRFLHMMVRLLVGTMVDIGRGRWSPGRMEEILTSRDVKLCGAAAPPHGLTLVAVEYPTDPDGAGDFG